MNCNTLMLLVILLSLIACTKCDSKLKIFRRHFSGMRGGRADHVGTSSETQIPTESGPSEPIVDENITKRAFSRFRVVENFFVGILSSIFTDPDLLILAARICSGLFWSYVFLSILGSFGFDTKPLLSLFSVLGLTFGLAGKDLISNAFQGIFILFSRPFQRGDIIQVDGHKGKVTSVDIRYVKLRKLDDRSDVLIPLANVYKAVITIDTKNDS